jgi:hypothetical protein
MTALGLVLGFALIAAGGWDILRRWILLQQDRASSQAGRDMAGDRTLALAREMEAMVTRLKLLEAAAETGNTRLSVLERNVSITHQLAEGLGGRVESGLRDLESAKNSLAAAIRPGFGRRIGG